MVAQLATQPVVAIVMSNGGLRLVRCVVVIICIVAADSGGMIRSRVAIIVVVGFATVDSMIGLSGGFVRLATPLSRRLWLVQCVAPTPEEGPLCPSVP